MAMMGIPYGTFALRNLFPTKPFPTQFSRHGIPYYEPYTFRVR